MATTAIRGAARCATSSRSPAARWLPRSPVRRAAVTATWGVPDGDVVEPGTTIATVAGRLPSILTAERTALNFLGHLSGIATLTRRYVAAARGGGPARVWDTRKTAPGLRALEK